MPGALLHRVSLMVINLCSVPAGAISSRVWYWSSVIHFASIVVVVFNANNTDIVDSTQAETLSDGVVTLCILSSSPRGQKTL